MLTEQRFDIILKLLEERKSITVTELRELLDASESTVRRETSLHWTKRENLPRFSAAQ